MNKPVFAKGRALLIGIGEAYPDPLTLSSVVRADAEGLAAVLKDPALCGYPESQIILLLDEQATRANIIRGLKDLAAAAQPDETVFFFFSGHGTHRESGPEEGNYLVPVDWKGSDPLGSGIRSDELSTLLGEIRSDRVVVVLDACHSDGAVQLKAIEDVLKGFTFGLGVKGLDRLASGIGRTVISSCREDEQSMTFIATGHSLFTNFLLEGLRGKAQDRGDGLIRVMDLFHYLSQVVPEAAATRQHQQHPVLKAHAESNFPVALRKGGIFKAENGLLDSEVLITRTAELEVAPQAGVRGHYPGLDLRKLELLLSQLYPSGPSHDALWSRAGGDLARLQHSNTGRAAWHNAIRLLSQGGGGPGITLASLLKEALSDFSDNPELRSFAS
jgi:metacaspase-1